ncbi:MAG TPA: GNAT family protein, partial [Xanthobacteraceae bacterium]|nr:GNAT family protein [Xanthobacteraceae bacterium]
KGIGTEAVQALLDYCTDKLDVHRVDALIHPDNIASIRLVKRLEFRCEGGPLTDYWRLGDRYLSVMIYARINLGVTTL